MPKYSKETKEYRFLLKVCTLLMKANRTSIPVPEMVKIGTSSFKVRGKGLVNDLIDNNLFEEKDGVLFLKNPEGIENNTPSTNNNKGGENKAKMTNGERKVTIGILEFCSQELTNELNGIQKEKFLSILQKYKEEKNKRINIKSTCGFLLNKKIIEEKDGKIYLGEKTP